jgi:hypothetical protein
MGSDSGAGRHGDDHKGAVKKPYLEQLQELLHDMGGTHTLEDITDLIDSGSMQSFVSHETWVVTTLIVFPQATVLDIFLVVGEQKDFDVLEKQIMAFAREHGVTFLRVYARPGFEYLVKRRDWRFGKGWRPGPRVYTKRLDMH